MNHQDHMLKILHLNDLHSHFEQLPKIKRFFTERSDGFSDVLRFDIGDNVDRFHPLTEATHGKANVQLMNELSLTAATIGNNEGLGLQKEMLNSLYESANFDVVLANLKDKGKQPCWAVEKKTVQTSFGMTIDIFGLTAPYPLAYPHAGWESLDPEIVLREQLSASTADFTIFLSHLGFRFDEKAAAQFSNLDLIIGAHTHHVYEFGKYIDGTMLAAAGRYGEYIGEITLTFDEQLQCIKSDILAEDEHHLASEKGDEQFIADLAAQGHTLLQKQTITILPSVYTNQAPSYEGAYFIAKILGDFYQVPATIINSGMIVQDIPQCLTMDELLDILPHSIRMVKLHVTGAELEGIVAELYEVSNYLKHQKIVGMGFRGKVFGELVTSGMSYQEGRLFYQDKLVDASQQYQLLVPDQYLFASYFPTIKVSGSADIQFPRFMREIVADYFKQETIK